MQAAGGAAARVHFGNVGQPPRRPPRSAATYLLYNFALLCASPVLLAGLVFRLLRGKSRAGWRQRWGRDLPPLPSDGRRIWVHAASVGEVMAAAPILRAYRTLRPDDCVVLSVITPGGYETASALVGKGVDAALYAPFDVPHAVRRALRHIRPDVLVLMETEIWPNLIHLARRTGAKTLLLNGRISDRSFPRYRLIRPIMRWCLAQLDAILVQTARDAERFVALGAPAERVQVGGNSKFDQAPEPLSPEEVEVLRSELRLPRGARVLLVASTRNIKEEEVLWALYKHLCAYGRNLCLIHAPRHIDRADEICQAMRDAGLNPIRRSLLQPGDTDVRHLVLDTFGELAQVCALADVVWIGNSLFPPGGGQNLLQPLAQGKPVVCGPYMQNFRDLTEMAVEAGVAVQLADDPEKEMSAITHLLDDADSRSRIEKAAIQLIRENRGAAQRYAERIAQAIEDHG